MDWLLSERTKVRSFFMAKKSVFTDTLFLNNSRFSYKTHFKTMIFLLSIILAMKIPFSSP